MSKEYSKEVQLEILEEIIKNQEADIADHVRQWNYDFLLTHEYIEKRYTPPHMFSDAKTPTEHNVIEDVILTEKGFAWRLDIYERLLHERKQTLMCWKTSALLGLSVFSVLLLLVQILLFVYTYYMR